MPVCRECGTKFPTKLKIDDDNLISVKVVTQHHKNVIEILSRFVG